MSNKSKHKVEKQQGWSSWTPAKTTKELRDQISFVCHTARVTEAEYTSNNNGYITGLKNVGKVSPKALAVAEIAETALGQAVLADGSVARCNALRELSLWLGMVKISWL